jgi:hypothetical protein
VYEVEEDAVSSNVTVGMIGMNSNYTGGTGDTTRHTSTSVLISASPTTTSTLPLRILGLSNRPGNTLGLASTDFAKFDVLFNASGVSFGGVGILAHS